MAYMANFSLKLQGAGKLYLGGEDGFLADSVSSLSKYNWGVESDYLNYLLAVIFCLIIAMSAVQLGKKRKWENFILPIFLFIAVASALLLHVLFDVLYPLDRGIAHLQLLFFGSIPFVLDELNNKKVAWFIIPLPLMMFINQANFSYARNWKYEHFDERLLSSIPLQVNNIPTSTGGRFWQIDNELAFTKGYPTRVFQDSPNEGDTIVDYLIQFHELRPKILNTYEQVFQDSISELTLFKRKKFLKREKVFENQIEVEGNAMYYDLMKKRRTVPSFIRCSGEIKNPNIYEEYAVVFVAEDSINGQKYEYGGLNIINSTKPEGNDKLLFDFTYAFGHYPETALISCYIYNKNQYAIKGTFKLEQYHIKFD